MRGAAPSRNWWLPLLTVTLLVAGTGCTESSRYQQAVCVLVDTSGTYADQKPDVVEMIRVGMLPKLVPGDSLIVARIDSRSYEEENIVARVRLDKRPSRANTQKLAFARRLDAFAADSGRSSHTDIPGAMMLCSEHLEETGAGSKAIVVFSDMEEDLPAGTSRELDADEFSGIHVAAINVKKLRHDNIDPERYRDRLAQWRQRVEEHGAAGWEVILDTSTLPDYLARIR